jgi:hypothetical protein
MGSGLIFMPYNIVQASLSQESGNHSVSLGCPNFRWHANNHEYILLPWIIYFIGPVEAGHLQLTFTHVFLLHVIML